MKRVPAVPPTYAEVETLTGARVRVELVVNARARSISLRIDPTRGVAIATAPSARHLKKAARFAEERATWIARELAALPQAAPLAPFAHIPVRGVPHELVFEAGRGLARLEQGQRLVAPAPSIELFAGRVKRFLKSEAEKDFALQAGLCAAELGVQVRSITVRELRSRWGSCSADGALTFSWRVIMAPSFVLHYLAAHEVAHLREMNHSPRFWALVDRLTPRAAEGRAWLRRHGAILHAVR